MKAPAITKGPDEAQFRKWYEEFQALPFPSNKFSLVDWGNFLSPKIAEWSQAPALAEALNNSVEWLELLIQDDTRLSYKALALIQEKIVEYKAALLAAGWSE